MTKRDHINKAKQLEKGIQRPSTISTEDQAAIGLKNGLAGTALFYAELYNATRDPEYLTSLNQVFGLIDRFIDENQPKHFGWANGLAGVAHVLLRASVVTKDMRYSRRAVDIMKKTDSFIQSSHVNNSLYDGRAGILLTLINMSSVTKDPLLDGLIERTLQLIFDDIQFSKNGIHWYYSQTQTGPIVGWGFGTAGIAWALSRAGRFLSSEGITTIAGHALQHTLRSWNNSIKNWPDNRLDVNDAETDARLVTAFREQPRSLVRGQSSFNVSDGALGILLAINLMKPRMSSKSKRQASSMLDHLRNHNFSSPDDLNVFATLFDDDAMTDNQSPSVSGYYHLHRAMRLTGSWTVGEEYSIDGKGKNIARFWKMERKALFSTIIGTKFFRTISLLMKNETRLPAKYSLPDGATSLNDFISPLAAVVKRSGDPVIKACFKLEKEKLSIVFKQGGVTVSNYCQKYVSFIHNRNLQQLNGEVLLNRKYKLNPTVSIVSTGWNVGKDFYTRMTEGNFEKGEYRYIVAFTDQRDGAYERELTDFEEVLYYMREAVTGKELVDSIVGGYGFDDRRDKIESECVELILMKVQDNILLES